MKIIVKILIIALLILSCEEETPLTPEELAELNDDRAKITLDMTDNLELTLTATKFDDEPVAVMGFEVIFDPQVLTLNSYSGGQFGEPSFAFIDATDTTYTSFGFMTNISGTGELLKLNFQGSTYKETTIHTRRFEILDANGNNIYSSSDDFFPESICYIKEHPTNGEILFGGEYQWTNGYCWHIDTYNPQP